MAAGSETEKQATFTLLSSTKKGPQYEQVRLTVDAVEMGSILRWNLIENFDGASVWATPTRGRLAHTVIEGDQLIEFDGNDVSSYTNKQLSRLIEKCGDIKVEIIVKREIKDDREHSTSKSDASSEEDEKLNRQLAKMDIVKVNTSTKYQDPKLQRNIYISIIVTSLQNISNVEQTYAAQVIVDFEWQPMESEVLRYLEMEKNGENPDADWKPFWCPKFTFRNAMSIDRYYTYILMQFYRNFTDRVYHYLYFDK